MRLLNLAASAFIIVAVLMLPAAAGFAQDYPLEGGDLQVVGTDDGGTVAVAAGATITIRGGGFEPGSEVIVTIESTPLQLAVTRADERGEIEVEVEVPEDFPAGDHTLKATGEAVDGGVLVLSQPVEVAPGGDGTVAGAPAADADAGELARTGTDASRWMALAGLVIVGGMVALIATRRPVADR